MRKMIIMIGLSLLMAFCLISIAYGIWQQDLRIEGHIIVKQNQEVIKMYEEMALQQKLLEEQKKLEEQKLLEEQKKLVEQKLLQPQALPEEQNILEQHVPAEGGLLQKSSVPTEEPQVSDEPVVQEPICSEPARTDALNGAPIPKSDNNDDIESNDPVVNANPTEQDINTP